MSDTPRRARDLTPEQLSELVMRRKQGRPPEPKPAAGEAEIRRRRAAMAPLSFAQQRLWLLDQLEPGSAAYNLAAPVRLRGALSPAVLHACLSEISRRHESLRTHFETRGGDPVQVISLPAALPMPLAVHQVEISLAKLDCLYDGTLDQCLTNGMTPLAWSPLAAGVLGTGVSAKGDSPRSQQLRAIQHALDDVAARLETSRTAVALAWLMRHPSGVIPIIGTINPQRIVEATRADNVTLTRPEWYRLLIAARGMDVP